MDDVGRKKIQSMVCGEIGRRTFEQANADYVPMMDNIEKNAREYFGKVGITINFVGWADTFNFDKEILTLIREAKCITRIGIDIPESAKIVLLQEDKFKHYFSQLSAAARDCWPPRPFEIISLTLASVSDENASSQNANESATAF